ncbi:MAG TPA: ABC transporter permease [Candidatus Acidoferrum sp.]|nr:ABC transporter permease [Candidatus Acidoferrum sp.]
MTWLKIFFSRVLALLRKRHLDDELSAELQSHLETLTEENIRRGMSPEEARYAARREFGGLEQAKEAHKQLRSLPAIENFARDLRLGIRVLSKSPGFTAVAVITLALGIGANTAVFSLVNAALIRRPPYHDPQQLLLLTETLPQLGGNDEVGVAAAEYLDYRDQNRCFSQVAAYEKEGFNLTGDGTPLRVQAAGVSASAFPLLVVSAQIGRTFTEEEDRDGAPGVVLLSDSLWRNLYNASPYILGKTIRLDEKPFTIVGVMPPGFQFPFDGAPLSERADLWVPIAFSPDRFTDRIREFGVGFIGRLKPGVTPALAQRDILRVADDFMRGHPESYSGRIRVSPRTYPFVAHASAKIRPLVVLLEAAVLCVLLIACANVANLLMAKARSRRREMAVRCAVGAARGRLLSQCLVESSLLSLLGAGAGVALAVPMISAARQYGPTSLPQLQNVTLDHLALVFTLVLSVLITLSFGLIPALQLSRVSPQVAIKDTAQVGRSQATRRLQDTFVILEIGAALALLIGGSLLLQSFVHLLNVPTGFRPQNTMIARTLFDLSRYPDASKREAVQKELLNRLRVLPGVGLVAEASHLPLTEARQIGYHIEGAPPDEYHWAHNSLVSPGYFQAMGISILRGRDFTEQDDHKSPNVAVISETLARHSFPNQEPIGKRYNWGGLADFTIIGVAADVRMTALDADPPPMIYNSMFQIARGASGRTAFVLKLDSSNESVQQGIFQTVQQQVWSLDRDLPIYGVSTMQSLMEDSVSQRRFTMLLIGGFGVLALLLAVIGLFGVVSYVVVLRQQELALRVALGAANRNLGWMVLKQGGLLGIAGCVLGLIVFMLGSSLLSSSLYQTSRYDLPTLFLAPLILFLATLCASYWPARRAMRVDLMALLRYE